MSLRLKRAAASRRGGAEYSMRDRRRTRAARPDARCSLFAPMPQEESKNRAGSAAAAAAVGVAVAATFAAQFVTIPRLKEAVSGVDGATFGAAFGALAPADWTIVGVAAAAVVALVVLEIRTRAVTRGLRDALDGRPGPRRVVF